MGNGTVVLLGAGASREAGIPVTRELTEAVIKDAGARRVVELEEREARARARGRGDDFHRMLGQEPAFPAVHYPVTPVDYTDPLSLIYGRMFEQAVRAGSSPSDVAIDLEEVVTVADILASRRHSHLSAMVREWDPTILELDHASTGWITGGSQPVQYDFGLSRFVEKAIVSRFREGEGWEFESARRRVEDVLPDHLDIDPELGVGHLHPLLSVDDPVDAIASLCFDLTVETAAHELGVPISTGIADWDDSLELSFDDGAIPLLKLHGSIGATTPGHRLVLGGVNKLTARGPYLALLVQFSDLLKTAERLVVIGYSFRDDHINSIIEAHLRVRERVGWPFELVVVSPDVLATLVTRRQKPRDLEFLEDGGSRMYWPGAMDPTGGGERLRFTQLRAVELRAGEALADGVAESGYTGGVLSVPSSDPDG